MFNLKRKLNPRPLAIYLLLGMLLISRSMNLRKICISSLYSYHKQSFPSILVFRFLLLLLISSSISQIIKELCYSSSYSFQSYIFFCFSNHQGAVLFFFLLLSILYLLLFLKSSRSCVILLPIPFNLVICSSMSLRRRQYLLRMRITNPIGFYTQENAAGTIPATSTNLNVD